MSDIRGLDRPAETGQWSEAALRVLKERYLAEGETPEDMCWRVARKIASAEREWGQDEAAIREVADRFYELMVRREFLPNCLTLDSLIAVEGGLQPLGDIPAGPTDVCIATDEGEQQATLRFANGPKRILTVRTASGYTVRATPEHLFRAIDETGAYVWRPAGDLREGDWMALQRDFLSDAPPSPLKTTWPRSASGRPRQKVHLPEMMTSDLAELVGYYIGDGYIKKEEGQPRVLTLAVDAQDKDVTERLTDLLFKLFWLEPKVTPIPGKRCVVVSVNSTEVCQFFYENGLAKIEGSASAHVPKAVLRGGREIARSFLRGLFEADGTVGTRAIELDSTSSCLIKDCQLILLGLGVASRYPAKPKRLRLGIRKNQDGATFVQLVGFLGRRKNRAALAFVTVSDNAMGHVVPHQTAALHAWYQKNRNHALYRQIARFMIVGPSAQPISTEAFHRYASRFPALEESPVAEHVTRRQFYDPVISIVPGMVEETGDLHVPANHTFIANGFVSHNSPTLMNAGRSDSLQYSACYVLPIEDSIEGIYGTMRDAAIVHQSGGGTGFSFSRLRPRGSPCKRSGGTASGPVSFLRAYDAATEAIKQGGRRRGANMAVLRCDHPDVLDFIDCKLDGGIRNFNISVAITDAFMQALKDGTAYELVNPHTGLSAKMLLARDVWEAIVQAAWRTGDPGLFFIDRVNESRANPVPALETIETPNPCGEQPLGPNDVCNLGSINLARFYRQSVPDDGLLKQIDWGRLRETVHLAVRFLDDVIEVNPYPLPEIAETARANRRVGLGVMGWADLLMELGISYDSVEALDLADKLMHQIGEAARIASVDLAKARGPFPRWLQSIYNDERAPRRNATVTTIAPTGSLSILADCSSGIEPAFALAYQHRVKQADGERVLDFFNPIFERRLRQLKIWSEAVKAEVLRTGVCPSGELWIESVTGRTLRAEFKTAHEIAPEWHVRHQAAFQKHTDNGVSKTINLPASATPEDVSKAYLLAWELGCLGITVFRDGCKGEQVLHVGMPDHRISVSDASGLKATGRSLQEAQSILDVAHSLKAKGLWIGGNKTVDPERGPDVSKVKPRPKVVTGKTYRMVTPLGAAFVTVNENGTGEPFEVFVNVGKAGSDTAAVSEALGRLLSLALRMPSPMPVKERVEQIVKQLGGIGGRNPVGFGKAKVRSLPDAIAKTLMYHTGLPGTLMNRERETDLRQAIGDLCPDCGVGGLVYEEGCVKCYGCGYSEC